MLFLRHYNYLFKMDEGIISKNKNAFIKIKKIFYQKEISVHILYK